MATIGGYDYDVAVYVDGTNGNDANDGLAPTDEGGGVGPMATIYAAGLEAETQAAAGTKSVLLYMAQGTYQGGAPGDGTNFAFRVTSAYDSHRLIVAMAPPATMPGDGASGEVVIGADAAAYANQTVLINGNTATELVLLGTDTLPLTVQKGGSGVKSYGVVRVNANTGTGTVIVDGATLLATGTVSGSASCVTLQHGDLTVKNGGVLKHSSTFAGASGALVTLSGSAVVGDIIFQDCHLETSSNANTLAAIYWASVTSVANITFTNVTALLRNSSAGLRCDTATGTVTIDGLAITCDGNANQLYPLAVGTNDPAAGGGFGTPPDIDDVTIHCTGSATPSHAFLLGKDCVNATVDNLVITGDGTCPTYGLVLKNCSGCTINGVSCYSDGPVLYFKGGQDNLIQHGSLVCNSSDVILLAADAAPGLGDPTGNRWVNCILDSASGDKCIETTLDAIDYGVSDYNLYYTAGTLANINGDLADLAALLAKWTAMGETANDANSIEGDPLLADPAGGDFTPLATSPAIGAASDGTNIGYVQTASAAWSGPSPESGWAKRITSADATGAVPLVASPGAGRHLCLAAVEISAGEGNTVTVGAGETSDAVSTPIVGPLTFAGVGQASTVRHRFVRPVRLADNTSLVVDAGSAGVVTVHAEGTTEG